jgi:hypothetical protein
LRILYDLLTGSDFSLGTDVIMLTLVQIRSASTSPVESASLVADYLAFDRRRTTRRQYLKAFGGMAVLVLLGAVFGRVPGNEAEIAASLLLLPPLVLAIVEAFHWRRLVRRLNSLRGAVQTPRKS